MKICEHVRDGVAYWMLDRWQDEGVHHGFIGADLDILQGKAEWQRVFGVIPGEGFRELVLLNQVHGENIVELLGYDDYLSIISAPEPLSADAWIIDSSCCDEARRLSCGIKTADCIPVLARVRGTSLIAAAHCGWRGAVGGLLPKLIRRLYELGASASSIELILGPGAGVCCYELSQDVATKFDKALELCSFQGNLGEKTLMTPVCRSGLGMYCDIRALLQAQAVANGLALNQIVIVGICTICDRRFFSYRRQKALSGRQLSFIGAHFS